MKYWRWEWPGNEARKLLFNSSHPHAVTMEVGSGSSGMEVYNSSDMPSPTSTMEVLLYPHSDTIPTDNMLSPTSTLDYNISLSDSPSPTNILYSSNIPMVSFSPIESEMPTHTTTYLPTSPETEHSSAVTGTSFPTETGMPTYTTAYLPSSSGTEPSTTEIEMSESPFPTETGMPTHTTTDQILPTSPETETSTTETGTSPGMSDITLPLSIALGIILGLVLLFIVCAVIYKCSARKKSGGY